MFEDFRRIELPMFWNGVPDIPGGGLKARHLITELCTKDHAVLITTLFHSRLPNTQTGPWMYAFKIHYCGYTFGTALWNNPSARMLPAHWLELRRLTCAPDAPKFTASRMLGAMKRWFQANHPEHQRLISYQDRSVHKGTIYKASGWTAVHISEPRDRARWKPRDLYGSHFPTPLLEFAEIEDVVIVTGSVGDGHRAYRLKNHNDPDAERAGKIRWETALTPDIRVV